MASKFQAYTKKSSSCGRWTEECKVEEYLCVNKAHYLDQDCMFDLCLYKRDEQFAECAAIAAAQESEIAAQKVQCKPFKFGTRLRTATKIDFAGIETTMFEEVKKELGNRLGWTMACNYGYMRDRLQSNNADGNFVNATCDSYNELIDLMDAAADYRFSCLL